MRIVSPFPTNQVDWLIPTAVKGDSLRVCLMSTFIDPSAVLTVSRKNGRIGDCCVTHDIILGHASAGQIIEVGSEVNDFAAGIGYPLSRL